MVKTEAEKRARLDKGLPAEKISQGKSAKTIGGGTPTKRVASMPGRGKKTASVGK